MKDFGVGPYEEAMEMLNEFMGDILAKFIIKWVDAEEKYRKTIGRVPGSWRTQRLRKKRAKAVCKIMNKTKTNG